MNDDAFRILLAEAGGRWPGYRKVRRGVQKRLRRHMQALGCPTVEAYRRRIRSDPAVRRDFRRCLAVSISRFFRDRRMWEVLETRLLPDLVRRHPHGLRVWSAGCARGEEAYTFATIWERQPPPRPSMNILATDLHPGYLEQARCGAYGRGSLRDVPEPVRETLFIAEGPDRWRIRPHLQQRIDWRVHDLVHDPPPETEFAIIFLRNNLLTYVSDPARFRAFSRIVHHLAPDGVLAIGAHERLPRGDFGLAPHPDCPLLRVRS
jgi:chemotaxis protein methyltransferase CheR